MSNIIYCIILDVKQKEENFQGYRSGLKNETIYIPGKKEYNKFIEAKADGIISHKGVFFMKIGFGSDHAAIHLKTVLLEHLKEKGYECVDFGAYSPEEKMDYPIAGRAVAEAIRRGDVDMGVLVCGTGVGISLAANKVPGIRAGVCSDAFTAKMIREHNECQIIAMGERVVGTELAKLLVDQFFDTQPLGGRHHRRVELIADIERDYGYHDVEIR